MNEVKRYDAVHIRYEGSNIRYGDGSKVEMVTARDYDALAAELVKARRTAAYFKDEVIAANAELSALKAGAGEPVMVIGMYDVEREPHLLSWNAFTVGTHQLYAAPQPAQDVSGLVSALKNAQEDITWMINTGQFLNAHVFGYIDAALAQYAQGGGK